MSLPNLAKVATADLVDTIGTGKFSASYINWARTMQLLREHAPGWMPELVPAASGDVVHPAPVGAYLMIRFRNGDTLTPPVPQAVMDHKNAAIPMDRITARDITDTHRRGVCLAAAFTFGLGYELWAKIPLESGYPVEDTASRETAKPAQSFDAAAVAQKIAAQVKAGKSVEVAAWLSTQSEAKLNAVWALLSEAEQGSISAVWPVAAAA